MNWRRFFWPVMVLLIALLVYAVGDCQGAEGTRERTDISDEQLDRWAEPFRGWHYHPDFVIQPRPFEKGGPIEQFSDVRVVDVPTVYRIPGEDRWYMTFIGFDGRGYRSFLASSEDLVQWRQEGLAMGYGAEGRFDYGGAVLGAFLYQNYDLKSQRTLKKHDGKYWSLYGAYPRQGGYELRPGSNGVAESTDGRTWKSAVEEPILSVHQGSAQPWEKSCIYQPWLVEHGGMYWNLYNAAQGHVEQIGLATSQDLLNWSRYAENPIVSVGPRTSDRCADPKVFRQGDHWVMLFYGLSGGHADIRVAFSMDLKHWRAHPEPLYTAGGHPKGLDSQHAHKISLVYNAESESFYMFYCAVGKKGRGIALLTSKALE